MAKKSRENLKRFLKEIIGLIVGKQAEGVADLLDSNKHVNEFIIAKKLGLTINQTRNILYKISDQGLVSFVRKKDKKKGWYTYFWKIEVLKALEFYEGILLNKIDEINNQIKSRETKQFYVCELCKVEFNEETALLKDFTCSECGSVFSLKDNSLLIKELKKNLAKLEKELSLVREEIEKERDLLDKKRVREINAREKEKKLARQKKREAKKPEKKKVKKEAKPKKVKNTVGPKAKKSKSAPKKSKKVEKKLKTKKTSKKSNKKK